MTTAVPKKIEVTPKPFLYREKIGSTTWELPEALLDVADEVALWNDNPRLGPYLPGGNFASEVELEAALRKTPGYDDLKKSITKVGQIEPIYVWSESGLPPYLSFEGATRLTIMRELDRTTTGTAAAGKFRRIKAKVLPPHFSEVDRVILLAGIHVRGSGVRAWGRYTQSKFIYENVAGDNATMSVTEMADYMGKSVSWVQRLRDAYEFAMHFVHHIDDPATAEKLALENFSTLEEVSKATTLGSWLRDYKNPTHDQLRAEVFGMVSNGVFKEYRDARFLKEFYDDPEKWALLKAGEKGIANRLAAEVKTNSNSLKAKIASLESAVERAVQRDDHGLNEDDAESLRGALSLIQQHVHMGADSFVIDLKNTIKLLANTTMANAKALSAGQLAEFREALGYFDMLVEKYGPQA